MSIISFKKSTTVPDPNSCLSYSPVILNGQVNYKIGKINSIFLPLVRNSYLNKRRGAYLFNRHYHGVCEVKDSSPKRQFVFIPTQQITDANMFIQLKLAGLLNMGPNIYDIFVAKTPKDISVVIEMQYYNPVARNPNEPYILLPYNR